MALMPEKTWVRVPVRGAGGAACSVVLPGWCWGETLSGDTNVCVDGGDGQGGCADACAERGVNAISLWEGRHQDRRELSS